MTANAVKIEQEFKRLAPSEQVQVYDRLGQLVFGEDTENETFVETLKQRVKEIEAGTVRGRDAFRALDKIKAKHSA